MASKNKGTTRQQDWQAAQVAAGRCRTCGKPRGDDGTNTQCRRCAPLRSLKKLRTVAAQRMAELEEQLVWWAALQESNAKVAPHSKPPAGKPRKSSQERYHWAIDTFLQNYHSKPFRLEWLADHMLRLLVLAPPIDIGKFQKLRRDLWKRGWGGDPGGWWRPKEN